LFINLKIIILSAKHQLYKKKINNIININENFIAFFVVVNAQLVIN